MSSNLKKRFVFKLAISFILLIFQSPYSHPWHNVWRFAISFIVSCMIHSIRQHNTQSTKEKIRKKGEKLHCCDTKKWRRRRKHFIMRFLHMLGLSFWFSMKHVSNLSKWLKITFIIYSRGMQKKRKKFDGNISSFSLEEGIKYWHFRIWCDLNSFLNAHFYERVFNALELLSRFMSFLTHFNSLYPPWDFFLFLHPTFHILWWFISRRFYFSKVSVLNSLHELLSPSQHEVCVWFYSIFKKYVQSASKRVFVMHWGRLIVYFS